MVSGAQEAVLALIDKVAPTLSTAMSRSTRNGADGVKATDESFGGQSLFTGHIVDDEKGLFADMNIRLPRIMMTANVSQTEDCLGRRGLQG